MIQFASKQNFESTHTISSREIAGQMISFNSEIEKNNSYRQIEVFADYNFESLYNASDALPQQMKMQISARNNNTYLSQLTGICQSLNLEDQLSSEEMKNFISLLLF